jgi:site-specific recombinase XerD
VKRQPRPAPPEWAIPWIKSFDLTLRAAGRADTTIKGYIDNARWLAGWLAVEHPDVDDWTQVGVPHLRLFFVHLRDERGCTKNSSNSIGRALQAFFKWFAAEEDVPNPMSVVKPPPAPKPGSSPPPVIAVDQVGALLKDAERGKDFESRRDAALLRLFAATGGRVTELALLDLSDVDVAAREATVIGKGGKIRKVRFDHKCALALDRYLRVRARHKYAHLPALWLGTRRATGMTASGVRQIIRRRGRRLGLKLWPHLFRHTFAHNWLDAGGAEGDLMELCGWDSPQMLRHYGASARSARARRAYDRIDVMGGV